MKTYQIPGSKSYTNRALIIAALTRGTVRLLNPLYADDTEAMIGCLKALGIEIETYPDQILVHGDIGCIENKTYELFGCDSGTTARFILPLLCLVPGIKTIRGSARLNARPIRDLVDGLRALGAVIEYCDQEGQLPVRVSSSKLVGNIVHLKADVSSQFCSGLLLIAPCLSQGLQIKIMGQLISKPYVDMTVQCMRDFGAVVSDDFVIPPQSGYHQKQYVIEGDYSSAGYFFAMAALTQWTIRVENLNPQSVQADRQFLQILADMGNDVKAVPNGIQFQGKGIKPVEVDMEGCPDQVMTLAVLAAFANGITRIFGVRSLRVKETERVIALKNELQKMGIRTEDTHDTLTIYGGDPKPAAIETYGDHRMAMAFAVAGAVLPGLKICQPEVVRKTFPTFWDQIR